jgi:hypothetical protein
VYCQHSLFGYHPHDSSDNCRPKENLELVLAKCATLGGQSAATFQLR